MEVIATRSKQKSGTPFSLLHINLLEFAGGGIALPTRANSEGGAKLTALFTGPNAGSPPLELRRELPKCPHSLNPGPAQSRARPIDISMDVLVLVAICRLILDA